MKPFRHYILLAFLALSLISSGAPLSFSQPYIRLSQIGFRPGDVKSAVVLSKEPITTLFRVLQKNGGVVFEGPLAESINGYGDFRHVYVADFSRVRIEGDYTLQVSSTESSFHIGGRVFRTYLDYPLFYLLEQHCGYNAVFDTVCHQQDAIAVGGPDDGKRIDAVGGYHDASDYLRFLITTSYTTGILLLTYRDYPNLWEDTRDFEGRSKKNGTPDILDEARWGVEWLKKLNPEPNELYHQVADDRDHSFWDLPYRDSSDYGWGRGNGRPAYFATGKPQGLFTYQNESNGIANVAGRASAVFALAAVIWKDKDYQFSNDLKTRAANLYELAKQNIGSSESVPCRAPYRFHEKTFYDDLEWAGAELYGLTKEKKYLEDATNFAFLAADTSWMGKDTTKHYEYFPYVNPGHRELFSFVSKEVKDSLIKFYRAGLLRVRRKAKTNAFHYGVPFIWVSNNVATGLVLQATWFKEMSGSNEFDDELFAARDWIFGRNPWGQSFVIGVPENGNSPSDPHSVVTKELGLRLTGALVDGPVYGTIFSALKGLRLTKNDAFAEFQSSLCVYHDDIGDYSTNEPTIDGTASILYILANFAARN